MKGNRCWSHVMVGCLLAVPAWAVAAPPMAKPRLPQAADTIPSQSSDTDTASVSEPLRTLEVIDALRPDVDWTPDPFARRPNRFDGRFGRAPTPEEISLQHGGYLMYGITQALAKGGRWLNRATGGPAQIEHARARDVPLDDEQIARAARLSSQENGDD